MAAKKTDPAALAEEVAAAEAPAFVIQPEPAPADPGDGAVALRWIGDGTRSLHGYPMADCVAPTRAEAERLVRTGLYEPA